MPDQNHISYWNYLETVAANRNREAENTRHNKVTEVIATGELEVKQSKNQAEIDKIQSEMNLIDVNTDKARQEIRNLQAKEKLDIVQALKLYREIEYVKANTTLTEAQRQKVLNDIMIAKGNLDVARYLAEIQAGQLTVAQGNLAETIRKNGLWASFESNKLELEKVKLDQNEQRIANETALRINTIWKSRADVEQKKLEIMQEFDIAFAKMDIDKERLNLDWNKFRWDNLWKSTDSLQQTVKLALQYGKISK